MQTKASHGSFAVTSPRNPIKPLGPSNWKKRYMMRCACLEHLLQGLVSEVSGAGRLVEDPNSNMSALLGGLAVYCFLRLRKLKQVY